MAGILKTLTLFHNKLSSSNCITSKIAYLNLQPSMRTLKLETLDKLKQLNIPEKPKKPLSPYFQYVSEKRVIIGRENPNFNQKDIIKRCAEEWRATSDAEKEKYIQKYKTESDIYNDEICRYNAKLTTEQLAVLKEANSEKRNEKEKKKMKKLIKDNNKPKRPMSPYLLFLQEQRQTRDLPPKLFFSALQGEWEKLTEPEKQRYKDTYLQEKAKYEKDILEWEKKMLSEGHKELIRIKSSIQKIPPGKKAVKAKKEGLENALESHHQKGEPSQ